MSVANLATDTVLVRLGVRGISSKFSPSPTTTPGLGVIHGGTNALRFTPHFRITKDEMDMQVDLVRAFLDRLNNWESLAPRLMLQQSEISRGSPKCSKCVEERGDTSPQYVGADGRVSSRGSNCEHKMCVQIKGHLFDENVINEVLNRVEAHEGTARMLSLKLGTSRDEVSEGKLEVFVPDGKAKLIEELRALVNTTVLVDELGIAGF